MQKVIERYFIQNNYNEIGINIDEIKAFYKEKTLYCIVNIQEKEKLTVVQFNNILRQLYDGVLSSGCETKDSVIFSCGSDVNYISKLYIEEYVKDINEIKVIVDTGKHRIIMTDNTSEEYMLLCKDISLYINSYFGNAVQDSGEELGEGRRKTDIKGFIKMASVILCIINVIAFIICNIRGEMVFDNIMKDYSVNWQRVKNNGEWYRIITSMFLHWNLEHIFNNMITLCVIGAFLEKIIGKKWIFISYFVTGLIAGLTSMGYNMFLGEDVYAAGASGAIFGLIGMLMIVLITSRADGANISGRRLLIYVVLVVWSSLSSEEIDNAAHIGGFIAGVLLGLVYSFIGYILKRSKE